MKNLTHIALRGGAARIVAQSANFVMRLGCLVIFAHLLDPTDFGLVGMVTAVTGLLALFREFGLSLATVQRAEITNEQTSTLFWINILVGIALLLISIAIAPLVATFFHEPRLSLIMALLGLGLLFNGAGVQHSALLQRQMRFGTLAAIDVVSLLASSAISIAMALAGYGYWALVAWSITLPLATTVQLWYHSGWIPGRWSRSAGTGSMVHFGGIVTLNTLVIHIAYNLDKVLLGRVWGAEVVGLYGRAYQLVALPAEHMTGAIGGVAISALSRLQHQPTRLWSFFQKAYSLVLAVTVPLAFLCAIFATEIIDIALGEKWVEAIPVFRILTPTALVFAIINPTVWLLIALGMIKRSLYLSFIIAALVITGCVIGLPYGAEGVAIGFSTAMVLWVVPHLVWVFHGTGVTFGEAIPVIGRPLVSSIVAAALTLWFENIGDRISSEWLRFLVGSSLFMIIYACMLLFVMKQYSLYLGIVRSLLARQRGNTEAAGSRSAQGDWHMKNFAPTSARRMPGLRVGDVVEVLSVEEILATLDERGELDGLPFMPEMLKFCGQRLTVHKSAHKLCDYIGGTGLRWMNNAVHLKGVRCDGQSHGGCQTACSLYWKEAWLRRVPHGDPAAVSRPAVSEPVSIYISVLEKATRKQPDAEGNEIYSCQATEMPRAAPGRVRLWNLDQYVADLKSGNVGFLELVRAMFFQVFNAYQGRAKRLLPKWLLIREGLSWGFVKGTIVGRTPTGNLDLAVGESVRIKPKDEITKTLDTKLLNRGLGFEEEMARSCGRATRVLRRVDRCIDDRTGKMLTMKTPCVVLDGVVCAGVYHGNCPREFQPFWREIWLERTASGPNSPGETSNS